MGAHKRAANERDAKFSYSWKNFSLEDSQLVQHPVNDGADENHCSIKTAIPCTGWGAGSYGREERIFNYGNRSHDAWVTIGYKGIYSPGINSKFGRGEAQREFESPLNVVPSNVARLPVDTIPLTLALQQSLDIEFQMIVLFSALLNHFDVEGVGYLNQELGIDYSHTDASPNRCCYEISFMGEELGSVEIYRNNPFSERQLEIIEHMLSALIHPLRNALEYQRALQLAHRDPLTGISNRKLMDHVLQSEIGRAQRYGTPLSLLMIDLDHFKSVNDSYGHRVGDMVLKKVSQCIQTFIRDPDYLFRFGGEEFVVILTDSEIIAAATVAERIRHCIASTPLIDKQSKVEITTSIGIAELTAEDGPDTLFERADNALYRAKQKGRNRTVY